MIIVEMITVMSVHMCERLYQKTGSHGIGTVSHPMQVNELRLNVSRTEQQAAWREDHLRQEVANMQQVWLFVGRVWQTVSVCVCVCVVGGK